MDGGFGMPLGKTHTSVGSEEDSGLAASWGGRLGRDVECSGVHGRLSLRVFASLCPSLSQCGVEMGIWESLNTEVKVGCR